jgi:hypothetical protein
MGIEYGCSVRMTMNEETIKVFRKGKGTVCEWRFDTGVGRGRILQEGEGKLLSNRFSSLVDAKRFCEEQVIKDAALIFYIMTDEGIVDTVMDMSYQKAMQARSGRIYTVVSTAILALVALVVSVAVIRLETPAGHTLFVGVMIAVYLLALFVMGNRNIEGAIVMVMILILAASWGPKIKEYIEPSPGIERTGTLLNNSFVLGQDAWL